MLARNPIYDLLKGIGIFLVVCGHVFRDFEILNFSPYNFIFSFHMPLFFFISGMLYHKKNGFVSNQIKKIGIPYIVFALLSFGYWALIERKFRNYSGSVVDQFYNIFYPMNIVGGYEFNVVLWFLPALFLCTLIYFIFDSILNNSYWPYVLLILTIIYNSFFYDISAPFYLPQALCAIPFFVMGSQWRKHQEKIELFLKKRRLFFVILALFTFACIGVLTPKYDMLWSLYNGQYELFVLTAVLAISALYSCCFTINHNKFIEWFGKNSLIIMLLHEPIKRVVLKLYSAVVHVPIDCVRTSFVHSIAVVLIILCVVSPFVFLINRYTPFLIGKGLKK